MMEPLPRTTDCPLVMPIQHRPVSFLGMGFLLLWLLGAFLAVDGLCQDAAGQKATIRLQAYSADGLAHLFWQADKVRSSTSRRFELIRTGPNTVTTTLMVTNHLAITGVFEDLSVQNGTEYHYQIFEATEGSPTSTKALSAKIVAKPSSRLSDEAFLELVQRSAFSYFIDQAEPGTALIRDRSQAGSPSSIAAMGFGLTALIIGAEHGWITQEQARQRTVHALRTLWQAPQGDGSLGTSGYKGWFYHFLNLTNATRYWNCELSSIDTALLMIGVLDAGRYFQSQDPDDTEIRRLSAALFDRVDWKWFRNGKEGISYGWKPESGFHERQWVGYNEAMILYLLGLGAKRDPLPDSVWKFWTSGYTWQTHYQQSYVPFPPLFGHQYTACWVDLRDTADDYMRQKGITYFENSRRATFANRAYCMHNPGRFPGYGPDFWGLTASDGPHGKGYHGYAAHGGPPELDDGTVAPTAIGGSVPFAPEVCIDGLRALFRDHRAKLWGPYGFRDAINLKAGYVSPDTLGIDQGPILIMIENYRTASVWKRTSTLPEIQRGLQRAGFRSVTR